MTPLPGPGLLAVSGAAVFQDPHATAAESPLPGGISAVVRLLFGLPQWVQIGGAVLGVLVAAGVLVYVWRYRQALRSWLTSRSRPVKLALGAAVAVGVLGGAAGGLYGWNYMQHDNGFCTGCHVMGPAYARFTQSEHAQLTCHDCHQQSMFASMRQLYLWVAERPASIGPHAKVPTEVCSRCHVTGEPEVWQRIASTAGHRAHLESQAPALRGVQCVTCHATEVHHFAPLDKTCAQSGCHTGNTIALGEMRGQTALHCTTCHRFTAEVPALATRDSARGTLVPSGRQCFGCHQMQQQLAKMNMDPARDPHDGTCGMCHNPHRQTIAGGAKATCASSGCHADWRKIPFHSGMQHGRQAQDCTLCHLPHQARVDPSDCTGCHQAVRERSHQRLRPPVQFDTTRVKRDVSVREPPAPKEKGDAPPGSLDILVVSAAPDSFPHSRHANLACLTCHKTREGHGGLTFAPPRGCQLCHHDAPSTNVCATCHTADEQAVARVVPVAITVRTSASRQRQVRFEHGKHGSLRCVECHSTPVTLEPAAAVRQCSSCHESHHRPAGQCATCHAGGDPHNSHATLPDAHTACDACHVEKVVGMLTPDRALCLTCHAEQAQHQPGQECSTCHLLATPEQFRPYLRKPQ